MIVDFYFILYLVTILNFSDSFFKKPFSVRIQNLKCPTYPNFRKCLELNTYKRNYHFSQRYTEELLKRIQMVENKNKTNQINNKNLNVINN